jgi:hypothetical protein
VYCAEWSCHDVPERDGYLNVIEIEIGRQNQCLGPRIAIRKQLELQIAASQRPTSPNQMDAHDRKSPRQTSCI